MALDQIDVDKVDDQMSFLEHLEVLRWHLVRIVIALFIGATIAFIYGRFIFDRILLAPTNISFYTYRKICDLSQALYNSDKLCFEQMNFVVKTIKIQEQFFQHIMIAVIGGFVLAIPYILYEIYRFVKPALKPTEKKYSGVAIFFSTLLFMLGVIFGYFVIVPLSINFLGNYQLSVHIQQEYTVASVVNLIALLTVGAGLIFQLPLVIYLLSKSGLITASILKQYRKVAIVAFLIIAAILTPPDPASQLLLTIPVFLLYEVGIIIAKRVESRNKI